jgi:hypothetical protein
MDGDRPGNRVKEARRFIPPIYGLKGTGFETFSADGTRALA